MGPLGDWRSLYHQLKHWGSRRRGWQGRGVSQGRRKTQSRHDKDCVIWTELVDTDISPPDIPCKQNGPITQVSHVWAGGGTHLSPPPEHGRDTDCRRELEMWMTHSLLPVQFPWTSPWSDCLSHCSPDPAWLPTKTERTETWPWKRSILCISDRLRRCLCCYFVSRIAGHLDLFTFIPPFCPGGEITCQSLSWIISQGGAALRQNHQYQVEPHVSLVVGLLSPTDDFEETDLISAKKYSGVWDINFLHSLPLQDSNVFLTENCLGEINTQTRQILLQSLKW